MQSSRLHVSHVAASFICSRCVLSAARAVCRSLAAEKLRPELISFATMPASDCGRDDLRCWRKAHELGATAVLRSRILLATLLAVPTALLVLVAGSASRVPKPPLPDEHSWAEGSGSRLALSSRAFRHHHCHGGDSCFGSGIASETGILEHDGHFYMEVTRKSVHQRVGGFGREVDNQGFYHFIVRGTGILLRLGMPVMDYTCPSWVLSASNYTTHVMPRWKVRPANKTAGTAATWRPYPEDYAFAVRCVRGWCTPASCVNRTFDDPSPMSDPAYWKWDPPVWQHGLWRTENGFGTAVVFWAGHDLALMPQREKGTKVLVDLRKYGVIDASYANGSKMIACPPRHHYHVAQNRYLQPCECKMHAKFLNCQQMVQQMVSGASGRTNRSVSLPLPGKVSHKSSILSRPPGNAPLVRGGATHHPRTHHAGGERSGRGNRSISWIAPGKAKGHSHVAVEASRTPSEQRERTERRQGQTPS